MTRVSRAEAWRPPPSDEGRLQRAVEEIERAGAELICTKAVADIDRIADDLRKVAGGRLTSSRTGCQREPREAGATRILTSARCSDLKSTSACPRRGPKPARERLGPLRPHASYFARPSEMLE